MALQGTLKDFSITDIFQLIGQQGKSGTLTIVSENRETQIIFDKGSVVLARFVKSHEELKLGTMLLRAQAINADQLNQGLAEHRRIMRSLGDVLLAKGWITEATLSEFLALQTREVLFRVLQWKSGAYKFNAEDFPYNRRIITPISSDFLLMDGVRQLDEWPSILHQLGSFDNQLHLTSEGEALYNHSQKGASSGAELDDIDAAFAEFDQPTAPKAAAKTPVAVDENDRKLFPLVQQGLTLQQIIDQSRLGTFDAANTMANFVRKGWAISQAPNLGMGSAILEDSAAPNTVTQGIKSAILNLILSFLFSLLAVFLLFKMPLRIMDRAGGSDTVAFALTNQPTSALRQFRTVQQAQRMELAIGIYFVENLDYPTSLDQLLVKDILPMRDVEWVKESLWHYRKNDGSYELYLTSE